MHTCMHACTCPHARTHAHIYNGSRPDLGQSRQASVFPKTSGDCCHQNLSTHSQIFICPRYLINYSLIDIYYLPLALNDLRPAYVTFSSLCISMITLIGIAMCISHTCLINSSRMFLMFSSDTPIQFLHLESGLAMSRAHHNYWEWVVMEYHSYEAHVCGMQTRR